MACAIAGFGAAEFRVWRLAWFGALRGLGFVWFRVPQIAGLWVSQFRVASFELGLLL